MLLYDFLFFENTNLPAVIEGSMGIKWVEDWVILHTFRQLNKLEDYVLA